jgi:hypothetical protein
MSELKQEVGFMPYGIRWLIRSDLDRVVDLEKWSCRDPWTHEDYVAILKQRDVIGTVIMEPEQGQWGTIQGAMVYRLKKDRLIIERMFVNTLERHHGYGSAMIQRMIDKLCTVGRRCVVCDVPEEQLDVQCLLRKHGFIATVGRDCYVMTYEKKEV